MKKHQFYVSLDHGNIVNCYCKLDLRRFASFLNIRWVLLHLRSSNSTTMPLRILQLNVLWLFQLTVSICICSVTTCLSSFQIFCNIDWIKTINSSRSGIYLPLSVQQFRYMPRLSFLQTNAEKFVPKNKVLHLRIGSQEFRKILLPFVTSWALGGSQVKRM